MSVILVNRLQAAAEACQREEDDFRRESRQRLDALAALRIAAYRRHHLLKGMAEAAACEAPEAAVAAAVDFALIETGWSEADGAYDEVRERLAEIAAVVQAACAADGTTEEDWQVDAAILAMTRFETWYRDRFGSAFLDLLEAERGFLPVVDF